MQKGQKKDENTAAREVWEAPTLTVEEVGSATRGGGFTPHPNGDDGWYSS